MLILFPYNYLYFCKVCIDSTFNPDFSNLNFLFSWLAQLKLYQFCWFLENKLFFFKFSLLFFYSLFHFGFVSIISFLLLYLDFICSSLSDFLKLLGHWFSRYLPFLTYAFTSCSFPSKYCWFYKIFLLHFEASDITITFFYLFFIFF